MFVAVTLSGWLALVAFAAPPPPMDGDTAAALAALRDLSPQRQGDAVEALEQSRRAGEIGKTQIPLLAALVETPTWTLDNRRQVAFLLTTQDGAGRDALNRLSFSEQGEVRAMAIIALRWLKVLERLHSSDDRVREHAVQEVLRFVAEHPTAAPSAVEALAEAYTRKAEVRMEVRIAAVRGLVQLAPRSEPALLESLAQPEAFFFEYTRAALAAIGPSVQETLLEGLEHRDPLVRQRTIYVFAEFAIEEDTIAAIRRLENDVDPSVRKAVARLLAAF